MKSRIFASVSGAVLGLFFSYFIGFFGMGLAGAGHGTAFFALVFWAPAPLGAFIWPLVAAALPWTRNYLVAGVISGLLLLNYVSAIAVIINEDMSYVLHTIRYERWITAFVVASYLVAQILILVTLVRALALRRKDSNEIILNG